MTAALFLTVLLATWRPIQNGVELATFDAGRLYAVRIDPTRAKVRAALASVEGGGKRTAGEWCRSKGLAVAINMGMFQSDQQSNVGYLRDGSHVNNPRWNNYRSIMALRPRKASLPAVVWTDKEEPRLADYDLVVQNLRLITIDRKNVWGASPKRWSEAAVAVDSQGRLLFLFSRAPWSMRDFNAHLLSLPLDVAGAMHVEGGPEASLSIHAAGIDLDLCGSYETGFFPDDSNRTQWPIPNVLGVERER